MMHYKTDMLCSCFYLICGYAFLCVIYWVILLMYLLYKLYLYIQDEDDSDESEEETPKKVVIFLGWIIYCFAEYFVVWFIVIMWFHLYFRLSLQKRGRQIQLQKHLSLIKRQNWQHLKKLVCLVTLIFYFYFFWSILFQETKKVLTNRPLWSALPLPLRIVWQFSAPGCPFIVIVPGKLKLLSFFFLKDVTDKINLLVLVVKWLNLFSIFFYFCGWFRWQKRWCPCSNTAPF